MRFKSFSEFKAFMMGLVSTVTTKCDAQASKDAATIAQLSADAAAAKAKFAELTAALEAQEMEKVAAIAVEQAATLEALDALSTELERAFNPSPVADAIAQVVEADPVVVTPVEVTEAATIGEPVATDPSVTEAVMAAIYGSAEAAYPIAE